MIDLMIYPIGRGFYRVEADGRVLLERSDQPLFDGARKLQAEGAYHTKRISLTHAEAKHRSLVSTVGGAAKLTVDGFGFVSAGASRVLGGCWATHSSRG